MTRIRHMVWTPLMLGGIAPGILVLAALAVSFGTHAFMLANDHMPSSAPLVQSNVHYDGDSDSDNRTSPPGGHSFLTAPGRMLALHS